MFVFNASPMTMAALILIFSLGCLFSWLYGSSHLNERDKRRLHLVLELEEKYRAIMGIPVENVPAYARLGLAMHEITTTVHGFGMDFDEQLQVIPALWLSCMHERDALQGKRVGGHLRLQANEEKYILENPHALELLMEYHSQQQDQAGSVFDDDADRPHGNEIRRQTLKEHGRSIMGQDLGIWGDDMRKAFGFPPAGV